MSRNANRNTGAKAPDVRMTMTKKPLHTILAVPAPTKEIILADGTYVAQTPIVLWNFHQHEQIMLSAVVETTSDPKFLDEDAWSASRTTVRIGYWDGSSKMRNAHERIVTAQELGRLKVRFALDAMNALFAHHEVLSRSSSILNQLLEDEMNSPLRVQHLLYRRLEQPRPLAHPLLPSPATSHWLRAMQTPLGFPYANEFAIAELERLAEGFPLEWLPGSKTFNGDEEQARIANIYLHLLQRHLSLPQLHSVKDVIRPSLRLQHENDRVDGPIIGLLAENLSGRCEKVSQGRLMGRFFMNPEVTSRFLYDEDVQQDQRPRMRE